MACKYPIVPHITELVQIVGCPLMYLGYLRENPYFSCFMSLL